MTVPSNPLFKGYLLKLFYFIYLFRKVPHLLGSGGHSVTLYKFNQDPLHYFWRHRMKLSGNENNMFNDYMYNELKVQVGKANMVKIIKGNIKGQNSDRHLKRKNRSCLFSVKLLQFS